MNIEKYFNEILTDMQLCEMVDSLEKNTIENNLIEKIDKFSHLDFTDKDGRTLFLNAVYSNNINITKYLLEHNANINSCDKNGFTALHAAVQEGNIPIIELLLKSGAEINRKNSYGNNPIMLANPNADKKLFEILINYGSNPYQKNLFDICAIDCFSAYPEILKIIDRRTQG